MKTKWTPWPWQNYGMLIFGSTGAVALVADPEAKTTDDIKRVDIGCQRWDEAKANAAMLAAAPEMYEALEAMVALARFEAWDKATIGRQIILRDAESILAKARGES